MSVYVFSTLTASNTYVLYDGPARAHNKDGGIDLPTAQRFVTIAGGSNLPNKHMLTSIGVMTEVSDEDYAWLQNDEIFKLHKKNGYLTVRDKPAAAEKVAADMDTRDQSAPLVDADFAEKPPIPNSEGITGSAKPVGSAGDDKPVKGRNSRRA